MQAANEALDVAARAAMRATPKARRATAASNRVAYRVLVDE